MNKNLMKILLKTCWKNLIISALLFWVGYSFIGPLLIIDLSNLGMYNYGAPGRYISLILMIFTAYHLWSYINNNYIYFQPYTAKTKVISTLVVYYINLIIIFTINFLLSTFLCLNKINGGSDIYVNSTANIFDVKYIAISFITYLAMGTVAIGCMALLSQIGIVINKYSKVFAVLFCFVSYYLIGSSISEPDSDIAAAFPMLFSYFSGKCDNYITYIVVSFVIGGLILYYAAKTLNQKRFMNNKKNNSNTSFAFVMIIIYIVLGFTVTETNTDISRISSKKNNFDFEEGFSSLVDDNKAFIVEKEINYTPDEKCCYPLELIFNESIELNTDYLNLSVAKNYGLVDDDFKLESGKALLINVVKKDSDERYNKVFKEIVENFTYYENSYPNSIYKNIIYNHGLVPKNIENLYMKAPEILGLYVIYADEDSTEDFNSDYNTDENYEEYYDANEYTYYNATNEEY